MPPDYPLSAGTLKILVALGRWRLPPACLASNERCGQAGPKTCICGVSRRRELGFVAAHAT